LSDSTNSDSQGTSLSEAAVADALESLVAAAKERVGSSLFASNVHLMRAILEIAKRARRRVALVGRSVHTHARVAQATGYLSIPPDMLVSMDDAALMPR